MSALSEPYPSTRDVLPKKRVSNVTVIKADGTVEIRPAYAQRAVKQIVGVRQRAPKKQASKLQQREPLIGEIDTSRPLAEQRWADGRATVLQALKDFAAKQHPSS